MKVVFRLAAAADVPAVIDLLQQDALGATAEPAEPAYYQAAFAAMQDEASNQLIVGEIDGRTVATYQIICITGLSLGAARRGQIEGVRVASDCRGRGIGTQMLADAQTRAREQNCQLLQLTMNAQRTKAARFYEANGYVGSHIGFKRALD